MESSRSMLQDLQIENLFKHRKIADERALLPAALIQLTADGFEVKLDVFAGFDDFVVKFHQLTARLHVQIVIMQVHHLFKLRLGLCGVVVFQQRAHQFDVNAIVKRLAFQRAAADADDLLLVFGLFALFEHFDIAVNPGDILVVERRRAGEDPFVELALLQQRPAVELHHPAIERALALCIARILKPTEDVLQFVEINGHLWQAFPVVCAAIGDDAAAQIRRNLAKHRAHAAD